MTIIAIDPGCTESAFVAYDGQVIANSGTLPNEQIAGMLRICSGAANSKVVIEQIKSYGMAVGAEIFETCYWSGIFAEAFGLQRVERIPRLEVKLWLCKDSKAKDANIRQALIDRFGGKDRAIGKKASPGPLYGISGDAWSALAVAVTWHDKHIGKVAA